MRMEKSGRVTISGPALAAWAYALALVNPLLAGLDVMVPHLEYEMANKGPWLCCMTALLLAAVIFDHRPGRRWLGMPLALAPGLMLLFIGATGLGIFEYALILVDSILALALLIRSKCGAWGRSVLGALGVIMYIPVALMVALGILMGDFGETAVRDYPSPNGEYLLRVRVVDEGALGGRSFYMVYPSNHHLELPFGTLSQPLAGYQNGWIDPDALRVRWLDDGRICCNGVIWRWRERESGNNT